MKRAIYPLYAPSDEGQVKPILNALAARGLTVRTGAVPGKGDALVLFLSENLADNERVADDFSRDSRRGDACAQPLRVSLSLPRVP